jgi:hypothetical protein
VTVSTTAWTAGVTALTNAMITRLIVSTILWTTRVTVSTRVSIAHQIVPPMPVAMACQIAWTTKVTGLTDA